MLLRPRLILVHGAGRDPHDPVIQRLARPLEDALEIITPDLRSTENALRAGWMERLSDDIGDVKPDDILLGHSLGASQLLKWLVERQQPSPPKAFFALACPYWGAAEWEADEYILSHDAAEALTQIDLLSFWHGTADSVVPHEHLSYYQRKLLFAEFNSLTGIGHDFDDQSLKAIAHRLRQVALS